MPLPPDSTLPLFTQPSQSEMVSAKSRHAMIVRMSAETLDALELAAKGMDVEFSENPGIYIGDSFFPMRSLKEDSPNELYLRVPSAAKQMAPLRLYANVTGKFTIEPVLDHRMEDRIREVTIDAAKQRDRKVKLIDNPPDLPRTNTKKRKDAPTMFRNAIRPSDQAKLTASVSSSLISTPPGRPNKDDPLRKRIVHYIAITDRTRDQIIRVLGGPDCDPVLRRDLVDRMEKVAEPIPSAKNDDDPGSRFWRLKTASWLEVRPFEWPPLSDSERLAMARTARQKLVSLRIPETDPTWKHVTYRSTTNKATSALSASSSAGGPSTRNSASGNVDPPRRGVSSKEAKEKKAKPRPDSKSEIQMKDESLRATPRSSNIIEQASHHSTSTSSLRKTPGSGFRMGKSTPQDIPSHATTVEASNHALPRPKPADARAMRNKEPAPSTAKPLHHHSHSTNPERKAVSATQPQRIKKIREDAGGGTDSEREKHADHARVLRREKAGHDAVESSHPQDEDPSALKRKKIIHDNADYDASSSRSASQKKRKLEDGIGLAYTSTGEDPRAKDLSLPKKPEFTAAARTRVRKELSPLPPKTSLPRMKRDGIRTSLSTQGKPSTHESTPPPPTISRDDSRVAHKTRRRSPIYTSSEDERSFHSPRRAISIGPLPTPPMTTHHASPAVPAAHSHPRNHSQARDTLPLPTKHAELRARYSATYLEYLSIFGKLVAQKGKIDSMLKSNDITSAGSITDSDGDVELMDPEELARISSEYKLLEEELERIRHMFPRSEGDCQLP